MVDKKGPEKAGDRLRDRAEEQLVKDQETGTSVHPDADPSRLLHELQVHEAELEIQNIELRQARDAVEELLEKYTDLYDFSPAGYFTLTRDGVIRNLNLTGAELLGIVRSRLVDRRFQEFVSETDRSEFAELLATIFSDQATQTRELSLLGAGNLTLVVHIKATADPSGEECRLALVDITELQRARQDMQKNQKLESLGVLAGGIAHDFNNILTTVLGNISLARLQKNDPDKVARLLEEAEKATIRTRHLTTQLLTFAKGGEPVKKVISLVELLEEATSFATRGSTSRAEIVVPDDLWPVLADEGQINQVIQNLVINAAQSMPTGGTVTVSATNVEPVAESGNFVRITVADSGSGIPAQILDRIYEPYFSTKEQGSGLGLSVCHSIIRQHGGKIRVESILGAGTAFTVSLPALDKAETVVPANNCDLNYGKGQILVMDDEAIIRDTAKFMLEELGYEVECAQNGSEAIALYRHRKNAGSPFAAVIMDLTIPGEIGGQEAIAALKQLDPEVRGIVSSGFATDPVLANFRDYGFSAVLKKPYRVQELNRALEELLNPED